MLTFNKQQVVEKTKTVTTTETKREINVYLVKHRTTDLSKGWEGIKWARVVEMTQKGAISSSPRKTKKKDARGRIKST